MFQPRTSRTHLAFGWNMFTRRLSFVTSNGALLALPAIVVAAALRYFGTLVRIENQSGTQPVHCGFFYGAMLRAGGGRMRELASQVWPTADTTLALWGFLILEACIGSVLIALLLTIGLRRGHFAFQRGFRLQRSGFVGCGTVEAAWRIAQHKLLPVSAILGIISAASIWLFFPMTLAKWPNLTGQLAVTTSALLLLGPFILGLTHRNLSDGGLDQANQSLTCLRCGYVLGGSVTPPCPECGQRVPPVASAQPPIRSKQPILRLAINGSMIAVGIGITLPYFFDGLQHLRPHLLLQSDWYRRYGEVYERQLHRGFEGIPGERNLFTQPDSCLRIQFRDIADYRELVACVLYVEDPERTASPLPSELGAGNLIIVTMSRIISDSGKAARETAAEMNVFLFEEADPQRRAPVWRSQRVALWKINDGQPIRQWYLARAEDISIWPMGPSEEQRLLEQASPKINEILAANFSPSARVYRPARPAR